MSCMLFAAVALAQALSACATPEADADPSVKAIERAIGSAACDQDSQCRTLPLGQKACGGPQRWLAWSTKATDQAALRERLDRLSAVDAHPPARPAGASNCALVPDPGASCVDGRCALLRGAASAR